MSNIRQSLTEVSRTKKYYNLSLRTLIDMLILAINSLQKTNAKLEITFNKIQQSFVSLNVEEAIKVIVKANSLVDIKSVYPLYERYIYTVRTAVRKRNEVLAHLNIMLMKLNNKAKLTLHMKLKFASEDELLLSFTKIFHAKLFESLLFKKICNEIWRSCIVFDYKRQSNTEMMQLFGEHLDLYCQGVSEISKKPCNYFLHKAVIDNNLSLLQQLCAGKR